MDKAPYKETKNEQTPCKTKKLSIISDRLYNYNSITCKALVVQKEAITTI